MERIADYLLAGKDIWWKKTGNVVEFHDGHSERNDHTEGPKMVYFSDTNLQEIYIKIAQAWLTCINDDVVLPATKVNIYDKEGDYVCSKHFQDIEEREEVELIETTHEFLTNISETENEVFQESTNAGYCNNQMVTYYDFLFIYKPLNV